MKDFLIVITIFSTVSCLASLLFFVFSFYSVMITHTNFIVLFTKDNLSFFAITALFSFCIMVLCNHVYYKIVKTP